MMKFFRKHNKELLAVFMALLMIVFVGGSALQSLMAPKYDARFATCDFGDITEADLRRANSTIQILDRLGTNWFGVGFMSGVPTPLDWHLLREEAKRAGMIPDLAAVRPARSETKLLEGYQRAAHRMKIKPEVIYKARAELVGIDLAKRALAVAAVPSDASVRVAINNGFDKAKVRAIALPASAFVDREAEIPDAELEAQLAQYRETEPGQGMNFGYVVQPAVKVEYIKIDAAALAEKLPDATVLKRARRYYEKNGETDPRFIQPPEEESELAGPFDPEEEAAAQQKKKEEPKLVIPWEEAKEKAVEIVRKEEGKARAQELANLLVGWAREPWDYADRDQETRYRVASDEAKAPKFYESLVERLGKRKRLDLEGAVTVEQTDYVTRDKLMQIPELGMASYRPEGGAPVYARTLMTQVEPIVKTIPTGDRVNYNDYLALLETAHVPFRGIDGSWYVIRVIDVKDEHPAENLDEVRDRVLADARTVRGYGVAKEYAEAIFSKLGDYDDTEEANRLQQALDANEELKAIVETPAGSRVKVIEPEPFGRVGERRIATQWQTTGAAAGIFAGEMRYLPDDVVEEIFALGEGAGKAGIIEVKDQATVYIVDWVQRVPCRQDQYDAQRPNIVREMAVRGRVAATSDWFDPDKLHKRCGLEITKR